MTEISWRGWLNSRSLKAHMQWVDRGHTGDGRLVVVGKDLHGMGPLRDLRGARFVRCDMTGANLTRTMCDDIELAGCVLTGAELGEADFPGATIEDCRADGCNMRLANFNDARIHLGNWQRIEGEHSRWQNATVLGVDFRGAHLRNPTLDGAELSRCDFRGAELRRGDTSFDLGTAYDTVFRSCDFRGADLAGLRLRDTLFVRCAFAGALGQPEIEGACDVIEADFSAEWDGSDVRPEAAVLASWTR